MVISECSDEFGIVDGCAFSRDVVLAAEVVASGPSCLMANFPSSILTTLSFLVMSFHAMRMSSTYVVSITDLSSLK